MYGQRKIDLCGEFRDKVSEFRDGILPEDTLVRLESHRMECRACQNALAEEEKIAAMMARIPNVEVSPDFRDKVLRAWRLRKESVSERIQIGLLKRVQVVLIGLTAVLLILPFGRTSFLYYGSVLSNAFEHLPPEYRQGIQLSITVPTYGASIAKLQVLEGSILQSIGEFGSAIAPWSAWLYILLAAGIIGLGLISVIFKRSMVSSRAIDKS